MISPEFEHEGYVRTYSSTSPILCSISNTPTPEFAGDPLDDGGQIMAFMLGHAGRRLVQQQIAGIAHDGAADGDTPLVGVGQCPGDRSARWDMPSQSSKRSASAIALRRVRPRPTPVTSRLSKTGNSRKRRPD